MAIELISTHIRRQLKERTHHFRKKMAAKLQPSISRGPRKQLPDEELGLIVLEQTPQLSVSTASFKAIGSTVSECWTVLLMFDCLSLLQGIYTILRDVTTKKEDFIFFCDRLSTLLVEKAMEQLTFKSKSVITPVGVEAKGKELDVEVRTVRRYFFLHLDLLAYIVAMRGNNPSSVSRIPVAHPSAAMLMVKVKSGGPLENGLRRVVNDVPIGSLLVQSDSKTGEPLLLHVMLPACIRERHQAVNTWVCLLDAQVRFSLLPLQVFIGR